MALVVAPARGVGGGQIDEAGEERPADEAGALLEDRPPGEGDERPAGADQIGLESGLVGGPRRGETPATLGVAGEVGGELGVEARRGGGEEIRGEGAAVVDGAAQGDDGETGAGGRSLESAVPIAAARARRRVEPVTQPLPRGVELGLEIEPGVERRGRRALWTGGGERRQRLEGERGDAQQQERLAARSRAGAGRGGIRAQAAPPPFSP